MLYQEKRTKTVRNSQHMGVIRKFRNEVSEKRESTPGMHQVKKVLNTQRNR